MITNHINSSLDSLGRPPPPCYPPPCPTHQMDLEGWEGQVLRGGMKLLQQHVEHVLMEYSPGAWARGRVLKGTRTLARLLQQHVRSRC